MNSSLRNFETPTTAAVMRAYGRLDPEARQAVDELAQQLVDRFHSRPGSPKGLGLESAVRLLGCLGVRLLKHNDFTF